MGRPEHLTKPAAEVAIPSAQGALMARYQKLKHSVVIPLLIGLSGVAAMAAEGHDDRAPEATAAEATLPFQDIPYLEDAFIDASPADRKDGLLVGVLGRDGGNKDRIVKLAREIADGEHGRFDSLLISHKGKLLFESYYLRGRVDLPHPQLSVTKAYTNLAIGRAIQLGYLTMADLDRPLIRFFEDLDRTKFVEGAEMVTLHKAMTMRSGIRIRKDKRDAFRKRASHLKEGHLKEGRQIQAVLESSAPITTESQHFYYQSLDPALVMHVLDAVAPGSAERFLKTELLDRMGITNFAWRTDVSGLPTGAAGSSMTSRTMMKWGVLAMNHGQWDGEQLIPPAFVAKSINRIVRGGPGIEDIFFVDGSVSNAGYGYYWWQADMNTGDKTYFSTSAQGGRGQYIILIDALDLIVVATAHDQNARTMQMTADRILPAFTP